MKKVLSLLVIFVFLNVQLWAYAPNYSGGNNGQVPTGTYAGVLLPTGATATTTTAASVGVFSVAIPSSTGTSPFVQGAGVLFVAGAGYNINITGAYDPGTNNLQAILEGVSDFTIDTVTGTVTTTTNLFAQGSMTATLAASTNSKSAVTGPDSAGAERLTGTASVDLYRTVNANGPVITSVATFIVSGFQQSSIATVPTLSITTTTTGG